ncbi:MAG: hypothetical protein AMS20_17090 [Gemmatimonas sp. SG8_28]|nr:MAG: hypothetical protein AMS20_17090 [Gemmatimonas sp. SG8_28]
MHHTASPIPFLTEHPRILATVLASWFVGVPAALSAQQSVQGVVVRADTDDPVESASVYLVAESGSILGVTATDSAGLFVLAVPSPGSYTLHVHRTGYVATRSETMHVPADSSVVVRVNLPPNAIMLEAITVFGEAPRRLTPEIQDFLARRRMRVAYSFSREDFRRLRAEHPLDLLREIPGFVTLGNRAAYRWYALNSRRCPPAILVDGQRSRLPQAELIENLSLWNVYGVEVFRDWSSTPSIYGSSPCGTILIWTRAAEW